MLNLLKKEFIYNKFDEFDDETYYTHPPEEFFSEKVENFLCSKEKYHKYLEYFELYKIFEGCVSSIFNNTQMFTSLVSAYNFNNKFLQLIRNNQKSILL